MLTRTVVSWTTMALCAGAAIANPVDGLYFDLDTCDNHGDLRAVEELGTLPLFPQDELIETLWTFTNQPACPPTDNPNIPNALVIMTNLSGRFWDNLFYVADPETFLSNVDGLAVDFAAPDIATYAYRIDWLGVNIPLVFESMTLNNVFEPGETWEFIIQDYGNGLGLPPSAMGSLGFAGASAGDMLSSGSVVQFIPAPGALALLGLAALAGTRRRR